MKHYKYTGSITYNGKRYYVRADTKAELEVRKAMKRRDLEEGKIVANGKTTLSEWAEQCVSAYKTSQAEQTRRKYEQRMRHSILESLGNMRLCDIKPIHLQRVLNEQSGKSKTQINEVYQTLTFLFSHAKAAGLIPDNPTENLIKPKAKKKQTRRALTPYERDVVIKVGSSDRRYYFFLLMLFCGCRPSEAERCTGKDIVTNNGYHLLHIRGTKTDTGYEDRHVPIPDAFYELIKDTPKDETIAACATGSPITENKRKRIWLSFKRRLNIAMGCKTYRNQLIPPFPLAADLYPYCFRHEYCTDLARKGVDIRIAQKLMGHSNISLTANIYTNLANEDALSVAELLGATPGAT